MVQPISTALDAAAFRSGLKNTEIAAKVGVSESSVHFWRKGDKEPRGSHLLKLIDFVPYFAELLGLRKVA